MSITKDLWSRFAISCCKHELVSGAHSIAQLAIDSGKQRTSNSIYLKVAFSSMKFVRNAAHRSVEQALQSGQAKDAVTGT